MERRRGGGPGGYRAPSADGADARYGRAGGGVRPRRRGLRAFRPGSQRGGGRRRGHRGGPREPGAACPGGQRPRGPRQVHRGLLPMAGHPRHRGTGAPLADPANSRHADAHPAGPLLPRSRAGEGGRDEPAHPLAPGPALLQRGRPRRERLDPGGSGARGGLPGTGGGHARRPMAHAAHLPETGRHAGFPRAALPNCRTSRPTVALTTSAGSSWPPATPFSSTS